MLTDEIIFSDFLNILVKFLMILLYTQNVYIAGILRNRFALMLHNVEADVKLVCDVS